MNIGRPWLFALLMTLAPLATSQTVSYVHTDALGSIAAVTDQSRNVIERREYEPFGMQLTPAVNDGPGYTGHVQDEATGLTYMQQRYFDPTIGRFLSVDPVGPLSNPINHFNRYRYAINNPYRFIDPDGRADLNLFSPTDGLHAAGEAFDIPGMYTITAHATAGFVQGPSRETLNSTQLLERAGNPTGQPLFLAACNVGAGDGKYAQELADKNNSLVFAANGFTQIPTTKPPEGGTPYVAGDPVRVRVTMGRDPNSEPGNFRIFVPGNWGTSNGISSVTFNPETGKATIRMTAETGSRIQRTHTVCVSKGCSK